MTDEPRPGPEEPGRDAPDAAPAVPRRRRLRRLLRGLALFALAFVLIVAAVVAVTFTIDLGPFLRARAEQAGSAYLKRTLTMGRLSVRVAAGAFVIDDLVIGGLEPGHRPFLTAKRIEISMPLSALWHREILFESIVMSDWRMLVETWPNGRHSFPKFTRDRPPGGPKRWVTTLRYVNARNGQFTYEDHGTPWSTVARNLDVTVRKGAGYGGTTRFSKGTVTIQSYVPMWADMEGAFTIEGGLVRFHRLKLVADGSESHITGAVDLGRWPEQTWQVRSRVDFPRMRELFFTREPWRLAGQGDFTGTFHLFKGGRELKGTFASAAAGVNDYRFTALRGSLLWVPQRFAVTDAAAGVYGGSARFAYSMAPLGTGRRPTARFDATYADVDLATYTDAIGMPGIRLGGRASGHNVVEWPLGRFRDVRGEGRLTVAPPPGQAVLGRFAPEELTTEADRLGEEWGPFSPHTLPGYVAVGGEVTYRFDPDAIEVAPSRFATRKTYVEFQGRTAWGEQSRFPFHVTSADWQESDRLLAGIMTAFGSPTSAVEVGGWGEFDGVMYESFRRPRIEGRFVGERLRAWDVVWGGGQGDIVIENGYVTVKQSTMRLGESAIEAEGRFALGYPRKDGGEEINARVRLVSRDLEDLRHAFLLDDYPVDGRLSGEFHLYGKYETPYGFGRMRIVDGVAYGERFEEASASLRFEGAGVRLDAIEARKAGGTMTGAAYVGWAGTYSFNTSGRGIPIESLQFTGSPQLPLVGVLAFEASGSGLFEEPRYDVRLDVSDLFLKDEGIGEVTGRLAIRNTFMTLELEAASPRLAISGTGRIALTPESDAELTFRFTETSLDPYLRVFNPGFSPFTTAVASGSLRVAGELQNVEHLLLDATVSEVQLRLFDYPLRNDGPIRLTLEQQVATIGHMRLVGEGTRLDLSGTVGLAANAIDVHATGDANLGLLQGFLRDIRSSGQADLEADVRGPLDQPVFSGSMAIAGGRVRHFALPHSLDAVNGRVTLDATGARLDGLTARLGGGLVRFGGRIGFTGFAPDELDLTANGEDMSLRYPEGFRSVVDADLALRGRVDEPVLSGSVLVKSSTLTRRFEVTPNLLEFAGRATPVPAATAPANVPLRFDVRVVAPSSLRVENNVVRLVSSADLTLRGTYDRPLLFGRAEIERGEVLFEGRRYVVTRGTIDFSNPTKIEPFFDVEAETRVRVPGQTYNVTLTAAGTPSRFQWDLDSDPPLPDVDIVSILFGNAAPTDPELAQLRRPDAAEQELLQARAAQLLVSPLSAGVGRAVEQTFGVDTFQITPSLNDPSQQSSRLNPGARLTIGKRLSSRAYLTFSQSLTPQSTSRDQIILLEFDQDERLSWLVSQNEDRTYALEVRVRHAF